MVRLVCLQVQLSQHALVVLFQSAVALLSLFYLQVLGSFQLLCQ